MSDFVFIADCIGRKPPTLYLYFPHFIFIADHTRHQDSVFIADLLRIVCSGHMVICLNSSTHHLSFIFIGDCMCRPSRSIVFIVAQATLTLCLLRIVCISHPVFCLYYSARHLNFFIIGDRMRLPSDPVLIVVVSSNHVVLVLILDCVCVSFVICFYCVFMFYLVLCLYC